MKDPMCVYLKIRRDPENSDNYSVLNIFSSENQDLGSYDQNRLLDELEELKEACLEGLIKVVGTKIDTSLTDSKIIFDNLDDVIKFFKDGNN